MEDLKYCTVTEFCKWRKKNGYTHKVQPTQVHADIASGRITVKAREDGVWLIPSALEACEEIEKNFRPYAHGVKSKVEENPRKSVSEVMNSQKEAEAKLRGVHNGVLEGNYADFRAAKEKWSAELSRIKYETLVGKLIEVSVVRKALYEAGRVISSGHDSMAAQLPPILAGLTNLTQIEKLLKKSFEELDKELANKIVNLEEEILIFMAEEPEDSLEAE